jgi:hypothetical protein
MKVSRKKSAIPQELHLQRVRARSLYDLKIYD